VTGRRGRAGERSLSFSPMTLGDLPEVVEIERRSFSSPWSAESFRFELQENPYASLFVVRPSGGGPIIGFASVWILDQELKINIIAVRADRRSKGVGACFLTYLLDFATGQGCRTASLEVRPSNEAAIRLYRSAGFQPVGRRRSYYQDTHEDALLMALELRPRNAGNAPCLA